MNKCHAVLICLALAAPVAAQQSPDFPRDGTYVVHLTSSQFVSGFGEYLVPPLVKAFNKTGMTYNKDIEADYVVTVQTESDVGTWHGDGDEAVWLYRRTVSVGLSPADIDIEPQGQLRPSFSITTVLKTPDQDRVDELNCLISLATRELAARYQEKGHVFVDGSGCARDE